LLDHSGLNEASLFNESGQILIQRHDAHDDGLEIDVNSITFLGCVDDDHLQRRIENLMNIRHPCISGVVGIVLNS
jgi:hypothetical protein